MDTKAIKLESPCRIEFMNKEVFEIFTDQIEELSKKYILSIEYPLPNSVKRGIHRVVFLDKHLIDNNNVTTMQIG